MKKLNILAIISFVFPISAFYNCDTVLLNKNDTIVVCTTTSKTGKIVGVEQFRNGKSDGLYRRWHENGKLEYVKRYKDGCPVDTAFEYFDNGQFKSIIPYFECKRNGWRIELSIRGDTLAKGNARNGKSIGTHYAWWSNGKPKFKINYNSSGQKHGLSEEWREDGTRKDSIVYDNGDIIEYREYYENGKLRRHVYQKPVNRDINAVYYDPKGKKVGEVKNGKGTYISYSEDGKSARRVYMENDEVIKIEEIETE